MAGCFRRQMFCGRVVALLMVSAQMAAGQSGPAPVAPPVAAAAAQEPVEFEVATIKLPGPNGYSPSLRVYIQIAFGLPYASNGWVIGPDWIETAHYAIDGKPPEEVRERMKTMNRDERSKLYQQMQQKLLADRFHFKMHYETKVMPVYDLVIAKGGVKFKENPETNKGQATIGRSTFKGIDMPMSVLTGMLMSSQEIGGRVIVDKTGLTGLYDIQFKWTPMTGAATSPDPNGTIQSTAGEEAGLFTAIEEQLGLKLVPVKEPGQVVVVDHIERPTEN